MALLVQLDADMSHMSAHIKLAHALIATSKLQGHVFTSTDIHGHVVAVRNTALL